MKNRRQWESIYDFVSTAQRQLHVTPDLDRKVRPGLERDKSRRVILIGHSMGGHPDTALYEQPQLRQKSRRRHFLATPHHGAPQVLWAYTYGYNFANTKVSDTRMWEVMRIGRRAISFCPTTRRYRMMPRGSSGPWTSFCGTVYSEQEYQHTLDGAMGRVATYSPRPGFRMRVRKRCTCVSPKCSGDSVKKYPWVKYYMVAGTGQPTSSISLRSWSIVRDSTPVLDSQK